LTDDPGDDAKPVWSGSRIWYSNGRSTSGGRIYSVFPDGSGRTRYPAGSSIDSEPSLSPDGTKIAFSRQIPGSAIYVMNTDGSGLTLLTSITDKTSMNPGWSPDGGKIAFASNRALNGNVEIYIMNADGSSVTQLTSGVFGEDSWEPNWSPDGSRIAYSQGSWNSGQATIMTMDPDGSDPTNLTASDCRAPDWSPDGRRIVYENTSVMSGIFVMNADGSGKVRLTSGSDGDPCWSPDGRKIAFPRLAMSQDQIHVMDADGTDIIQLTTNETGAGQSPSWGPQSRFIMPTVTDLEPPNGSVEIPVNTNLTMTFNKDMAKGSGIINIIDATTSGIYESIDVQSPQVTIVGNTVVIDPPYDLHVEWEYEIEIPDGCFVDLYGNSWTGIGGTASSTWVIHTVSPGHPSTNLPAEEKTPSRSGKKGAEDS